MTDPDIGPAQGSLDEGLWLPVADLAKRKGIKRQSAHERVGRLVDAGKITLRIEGRKKLVNVAEYDRAVGEVGDPAKEQAAATRADNADEAAGSPPANPAFRDAATRDKQYSADLKFLELQERLGKVVPVGQVEDEAAKVFETIVRVVERLPSYADMIAAAVGREGPTGARGALKDIVREQRQAIADALTAVGLAAEPATLDVEPTDHEPVT